MKNKQKRSIRLLGKSRRRNKQNSMSLSSLVIAVKRFASSFVTHIPLRTSSRTVSRTVLCWSLSYVWLFAILWTVARQALLFMGFLRQEYRSGFPCPFPRDIPHPGIEPKSALSPALRANSLSTEPSEKSLLVSNHKEYLLGHLGIYTFCWSPNSSPSLPYYPLYGQVVQLLNSHSFFLGFIF